MCDNRNYHSQWSPQRLYAARGTGGTGAEQHWAGLNKCNLGPKTFSPENPIMSVKGRQSDKGHFVLSNGLTKRLHVMIGSLFILYRLSLTAHITVTPSSSSVEYSGLQEHVIIK